MSENLKPCPFCKAKMRIESNRDWHKLVGEHREGCPFDTGEAAMTYAATPENLRAMIEDWNRRAAHDAVPVAKVSGFRETGAKPVQDIVWLNNYFLLREGALLYAAPQPPASKPAIANFCAHCGKRNSPGHIHTCSPPADVQPLASTDAWTLTAPDGRAWIGETGMKALSAMRRDTVDTVRAAQNLKMIMDEAAAEDAEIEALRKDAGRYMWLREFRVIDNVKSYPTIPWVVRCELDPWPTTKSCSGVELDAAIDKAMEVKP